MTRELSRARLHPAEALAGQGRNGRLLRTDSFRRVPEQLLGHSGDAFPVRALQEAFLAARVQNPRLTPEQFLASAAPSSRVGRIVTELLGPAQARLLRTTSPAVFEEQIWRHYDDFAVVPPPFDAGISYPRHRYLDGSHLDMSGSRLLVLPANTPVVVSGGFRYPSYDLGRRRANRSVAAVQLRRVLGREIPLDQSGRDLFETLSLTRSTETFQCYLDPELHLSALQTAFTLSTGYSPIYRSALITNPDEKLSGLRRCAEGRAAEQARWELAARFGPEFLDDTTDLRREWERLRQTGGTGTRPDEFVADDAFSQASTDELFALALKQADAPVIRISTPEWEHHRAQRFCFELERLNTTLALGDEWKSTFRLLTGLCEPENLHFLMPWKHAADDFFAGNFAPGRKKAAKGREFQRAAFAANSARTDRFGNVVSVPATHADWERAKNPLVAYEPRHLVDLLTAMHDDAVLAAALDLAGKDRATWNAVATQLNQAADALAMPNALRLILLD